MEFIISRTSSIFNDNIKPCEEAYQKLIIGTDERYVDDPMKNPYIGESWYTDEGYFNHRVENGHIKRDYLKTVWMVEINTLEELIAFVKKYEGQIVMEEDTYNHSDNLSIEIYDSWRE